MPEISKGDTVQLKSGGPLMTVQELGKYPNNNIESGALCIWFDDQNPMEKVFDLATLEVYVDD